MPDEAERGLPDWRSELNLGQSEWTQERGRIVQEAEAIHARQQTQIARQLQAITRLVADRNELLALCTDLVDNFSTEMEGSFRDRLRLITDRIGKNG